MRPRNANASVLRLDRQWQLRLERAAQDASRAFRQYNGVEPENRLVARTLERAWEESLLSQRALEEEYRRFQKEQPVRLSAEERRQIETLRAGICRHFGKRPRRRWRKNVKSCGGYWRLLWSGRRRRPKK